MDWGEFFFVQAVILGLTAFGVVALHAGGWRHSKAVAALDRNPVGHFVLLLMAMSRLRNQDELDRAAAQKLPSLMPALNKLTRFFALLLAIILFAIALFGELMYLADNL